jgi:hypothetical protein
MPKACNGKSADELVVLVTDRLTAERTRFAANLDGAHVATFIKDMMARIELSLENDTDDWKALIPARPILKRFCAGTPLDYEGFRTAYIGVADTMPNNPFQEIIDVFAAFDSASTIAA